MQIGVIGTGYVGLVAGVCLADAFAGHVDEGVLAAAAGSLADDLQPVDCLRPAGHIPHGFIELAVLEGQNMTWRCIQDAGTVDVSRLPRLGTRSY